MNRMNMKILPYELDRYFVRTDDTVEVRIRDIVPGEPHAVDNANKFMWQAWLGERDRREPITLVRRKRGGYKAIDGNSTLANAIANGWPTIYATIEENDNA